MATDINALLDALIAREGGYVNHPDDRGGPTNFGITEQVARAYGYHGNMRSLPRETAKAIYRKRYWERPGFADVARIYPKLAAELFDTGVNMGPKVAATFLQKALNVLNRKASDYPDIGEDGDIGPMTISALTAFYKQRKAYGEIVLFRAVDAMQGARYIDLARGNPSQEAFVFGWLANRVGEQNE